MAKWKPGQSGNPNGRPPQGRALTEILKRRGQSRYLGVDGKNHAGNQIVASAVWEYVATGRTRLAHTEIDEDGKEVVKYIELKANARNWIDTVKWLYAQIDGPPKQYHDVTTGDGKISAILKWPEDDG